VDVGTETGTCSKMTSDCFDVLRSACQFGVIILIRSGCLRTQAEQAVVSSRKLEHEQVNEVLQVLKFACSAF
jgi:hypothetical protein